MKSLKLFLIWLALFCYFNAVVTAATWGAGFDWSKPSTDRAALIMLMGLMIPAFSVIGCLIYLEASREPLQ